MPKTALEVADIFRQYADSYIQKYQPSYAYLKVIQDIINCRTPALGAHHTEICDAGCGYKQITYNSCRNRHCPKCQFTKTIAWIEKRTEELLPVPYFHVVFTIPTQTLLPAILPNKALIYDLLIRTAAETLTELAQNPRWLGAEIGSICVLHTWTQRLAFHPHIHAIVHAGGITSDRWVETANPDFFIPFTVLAAKFAHKFLALLKNLNNAGKLQFSADQHHLQVPTEFNRFCQPLYDQKWVAYAKPSFAGPESVIRYLGNYIHKIAISNQRLLKLEDDRIFFKYRDRADNNKQKVTDLDVLDFMKMFLQHVLPFRFVKIRAYGLLANRSKKGLLKKARLFLHKLGKITKQKLSADLKNLFLSVSHHRCPNCGKGRLVRSALLISKLCYARPP